MNTTGTEPQAALLPDAVLGASWLLSAIFLRAQGSASVSLPLSEQFDLCYCCGTLFWRSCAVSEQPMALLGREIVSLFAK